MSVVSRNKVGVAHLSGAKIWVNLKEEYHKEKFWFFLSLSAEKFRRRTIWFFLKIFGVDHLSGAKFSVNHEVYHKTIVEDFSCHRKSSWGGSFGVSESFWFRKILYIRVGRGLSRSLDNKIFFCLTVPKQFRRGTLWCFWKFLVSKAFQT